MATERLQDQKLFPALFTASGMPSIHGGLAGILDQGPNIGIHLARSTGLGDLGQDPEAPSVLDWNWGFGQDVVSPDSWSVPPDVTGSTTETVQTIEAPPSVDPVSQTLTVGGWSFDPPGGASAVDPGWQNIGSKAYWQYADGSKMFADGTQVNPDGSYITPDGYQVNPSARTVTDPSGVTTTAAAGKSVPDALSAAGSVGASILNFVRGVVGAISGPSAPAGARPGQIFRASNGLWYRLNPDGTTTQVAAPGTGLFGGSGLVLVGLAAAAFLLLRKRHS